MHKSVAVALGEVGYLEKRSPEKLDEKLANPGEENYTKYARDMAAHWGFYLGKKQGFPWCDVFVDWCFTQAYGVQNARRLLCQPVFSRGAGCRYSFAYFREAGRLETHPQPGDQIFFRQSGFPGTGSIRWRAIPPTRPELSPMEAVWLKNSTPWTFPALQASAARTIPWWGSRGDMRYKI